MITVTVVQKQGATTRRMRVSAPSVERALKISGVNRPDTEVRVVFPVDDPDFFAPMSHEGSDCESRKSEHPEGAGKTPELLRV